MAVFYLFREALCVAGAFAVFCMTGCGGGEDFRVAPVSGKITMDGKPLANVSINFQPEGTDQKLTGSGSYGKTDEEGRYTLAVTTTGDPGAVVGRHSVSITTPEPEEAEADDAFVFHDPIPARYNYATTLSFEVPADGSEEADFKLTSEKDKLDRKYE